MISIRLNGGRSSHPSPNKTRADRIIYFVCDSGDQMS